MLEDPKRPPEGAVGPAALLLWPPNPPKPPEVFVFVGFVVLLLEPNRKPDPELRFPVEADVPKAGFCWELPKRPVPPEDEAPNIESVWGLCVVLRQVKLLSK